jgi:probable HAF family extracellular repeat protein
MRNRLKALMSQLPTLMFAAANLTACGGGGDTSTAVSESSTSVASASLRAGEQFAGATELGTTGASDKFPDDPLAAARRHGSNLEAMLMRKPFAIAGPLVSLDDARRASRESKRRYFITDLGSLGGSESFAYAINNRAQVVGSSRIAGDTRTHAFLYDGGRVTDLFPLNSESVQTVGPTGISDYGVVASGVINGGVYVPALMDTTRNSISALPCLGGTTSYGFSGVATAVNNRGVAVGYCYVDQSSRHAFVYSNGVTTDIDAFGGYSGALDVNDQGVATGFVSRQPAGVATAFVYQQGVMVEIFPAGTESMGRGINSHGQIVGEYLASDGSGFHAYLYSNGAATDIGSSDSRDTVAFAINDNEQVVGLKALTFPSTCAYGPCTVTKQFAFIWEGGHMALLDALIPRDTNWEVSWAFDINNSGQIVGYGERNGKFRAFLMTPAVSSDQCKKGGWQSFGFANQGQCIQFVNTGK